MPDDIRAALPELPLLMAEATRRANAYERGAVDLMEALVLQDQVGRVFPAVLVDVDARPREGGGQRGTVMLADPAVQGHVYGDALPLGEEVRVRVTEANPTTRTIRFELA